MHIVIVLLVLILLVLLGVPVLLIAGGLVWRIAGRADPAGDGVLVLDFVWASRRRRRLRHAASTGSIIARIAQCKETAVAGKQGSAQEY